MLLHFQSAQALLAQFFQVGCAVGYLQDPFIEPVLEAFEGAGAHVVFVVELMVTVVVALHGGWMRSPRFMDDSANFEGWAYYAVWVANDDLAWHDLFGDDDDVACCQHGLFGDAKTAPDVRVAVLVTALSVDDGDIGSECWYEEEPRSVQG